METTLFYWTENNGIKIQKLPFAFGYSFCAAGPTSERQDFPLASQEYLGLSSQSVEMLGQVCKFKAIYLGLCSTLHIQNINSTIHSITRGLNETAFNYCICKSPNNLLTYLYCMDSETHIVSLSTWMRLMHLNCLRKAITKSVSFSNLQVKKCLKEKLTVNMPLDHTVAFHDLDGQHQHTNLSHPLRNFTGSEFHPRHSCL